MDGLFDQMNRLKSVLRRVRKVADFNLWKLLYKDQLRPLRKLLDRLQKVLTKRPEFQMNRYKYRALKKLLLRMAVTYDQFHKANLQRWDANNTYTKKYSFSEVMFEENLLNVMDNLPTTE